jgi:hypothetical protein
LTFFDGLAIFSEEYKEVAWFWDFTITELWLSIENVTAIKTKITMI